MSSPCAGSTIWTPNGRGYYKDLDYFLAMAMPNGKRVVVQLPPRDENGRVSVKAFLDHHGINKGTSVIVMEVARGTWDKIPTEDEAKEFAVLHPTSQCMAGDLWGAMGRSRNQEQIQKYGAATESYTLTRNQELPIVHDSKAGPASGVARLVRRRDGALHVAPALGANLRATVIVDGHVLLPERLVDFIPEPSVEEEKKWFAVENLGNAFATLVGTSTAVVVPTPAGVTVGVLTAATIQLLMTKVFVRPRQKSLDNKAAGISPGSEVYRIPESSARSKAVDVRVITQRHRVDPSEQSDQVFATQVAKAVSQGRAALDDYCKAVERSTEVSEREKEHVRRVRQDVEQELTSIRRACRKAHGRGGELPPKLKLLLSPEGCQDLVEKSAGRATAGTGGRS